MVSERIDAISSTITTHNWLNGSANYREVKDSEPSINQYQET